MNVIVTNLVPTTRDIVNHILAIMRRQTQSRGEGWNGATTFEQAGVDSLELTQLLMELESHYHVTLNARRESFEPMLASVEDVARFVQKTMRTAQA